MAVYYPKSLARLVGEFEKLPGRGPKRAQRLAFHVMRVPEDETRSLADALLALKGSIRFCTLCHNYSEGDLCDICADARRDHAVLCVVAEPRDLIAMEKTNEFRGVYHVLHGVISPLDGVTPERLKIRDLQKRVAEGGDVPRRSAQAPGRPRHPHRPRDARRWRSGLRRPGDFDTSPGMASGVVREMLP